LPQETENDRKLHDWLLRNGPWLMKLDDKIIQTRVGIELGYGNLIGRSIEDSLIAAAHILKQEYFKDEDDDDAE